MGLFKEVYCKHCGTKVGMISRKRLSDGNYVCSKCASVIPSFVREGLPQWDYKQFVDVLAYVEHSKNVIAPVFHETHRYHSLVLDTVNGYFCYEDSLFGKKLYLQVEDVASIDLDYVPEKFKEGFISDKVTGDVKLQLQMLFPYFRLETTLAYGVKSQASLRKGVFTDKVKYGNPKGLDEFVEAFVMAHEFYRSNYFSNRFYVQYPAV